MGMFDSIKNFFVGTERVKTSKAKCTENKKIAEEKYKEEMKRIEAECESDLQKAKDADKLAESQSVTPPVPVQVTTPQVVQVPTQTVDTRVVGGKKGGKSKKRSKSNRKKTARK
jgi:hypothetical protein